MTTAAPYYQDEHVTVLAGDCLGILATLPDNSVHAVCTDPPYGLEFMGKDWDAPWKAEGAHWREASRLPGSRSTNPTPRPQNFGTAGKPFQDWCLAWARECLRVLKPGGHLLAFGGSRTWHRLAVAVEDAGFEIRDSIAWLYGSGFPKSLDVSKAIDKRPGVMRHAEFGAMLREAMTAKGYTNTFDVAEKVIGRRTGAVANWVKYQFPEAKWWPALRDLLDLDDATWGPVIAEAERAKTGKHDDGSPIGTFVSRINGTDAPAAKDRRDAPATDAAQQWAGWGTALKPAFEPIVVARKPLTSTVAGNVLEHGTGALNIDATRVAGEKVRTSNGSRNEIYGDLTYNAGQPWESHDSGRWPTNVLLDDTQAAELDKQSGESAPKPARTGRKGGCSDNGTLTGYGTGDDVGTWPADAGGGASRFFPTFRYEAKAPTDQRPRYNKSVLRLRDDLTPEQVDHVRARLAEAGVRVD